MGQMDPARAQLTTVSTFDTTNSSGLEIAFAMSDSDCKMCLEGLHARLSPLVLMRD